MTYYQTIIDNFDDNSFNATLDTGSNAAFPTTIWRYTGSGLITETSQALHIPANTAYPSLDSHASYDITTAILAAKLTRSGTATASCEFLFGVYDGDPGHNVVQLLFTPSTTDSEIDVQGAATISSTVMTGNGFNTSWTAGQWMGVGNMGSDKVIHFYKSSDGQTWTEIAHGTVGGTFNKTTCGLAITNGYYTVGESPTFAVALDDASYWSQTPPSSGGGAKVRVGGAWVNATPKVRVGGAWVAATPKARIGGSWVASS
jgi:hypothetical protein